MGVLFSVLILLQDDPAQEDEELREPEQKSFFLSLLERSHIESGMLFTLFDNDLDIDQTFGFYARIDVPIVDRLYAIVEYRRYEGGNSDFVPNEDVRVAEYLFGALYRWDLWEEADLIFAGQIGIADFASTASEDDSGLLASFTAGVNIHVSKFLHVRLAAVADFARTDFHDADGWALNTSGIIGIDIGF